MRSNIKFLDEARVKPLLSPNRDFFKIAVENSDLGVWVHDLTTDYLTWSKRLYHTLGVHPSVVPRLDVLQSLIHPDDHEWVESEIAQCLANKTRYSVEYRSIRPDSGKEIWLRCTGKALLDSSGQANVMLGTAFDITHIKHAEFKARAADRAKTEFLANMSHEIRTPMNAILGMYQVLEPTDLTAHQKKMVQTIGSSGHSLMKIIDDILEFSTIESEALTLASAPFNLNDCVEDVITRLKSEKPFDPGIELLVRVQPDLPTVYLGDENRLRQVMTILLSNALKFTEEGHVLIDVSGRVEDNIAALQFSFEDTGIGIPSEKLNIIFGRFEQVDNSRTRRYGGTGLGLAIVKQIVRLMDGSLTVESEEGLGSKFRFEVSMPVQISDKPNPTFS